MFTRIQMVDRIISDEVVLHPAGCGRVTNIVKTQLHFLLQLAASPAHCILLKYEYGKVYASERFLFYKTVD